MWKLHLFSDDNETKKKWLIYSVAFISMAEAWGGEDLINGFLIKRQNSKQKFRKLEYKWTQKKNPCKLLRTSWK